MKIIKPSVEILTTQSGEDILKQIEIAARTCYKTEDKISDDSYLNFTQMILNRGHEAMIEFGWVMARFVCDRGVTHEIVRHRLFSFAQESTRYCNYSKDKFGAELTFIEPCFWGKYLEHNAAERDRRELFDLWIHHMEHTEKHYLSLIEKGATAQEARSVLPNSLKTEIVIGGNLREWKHFFELRTSKFAHPQMKEVADIALKQFQEKIPLVFDNINLEKE